MTPKPWGEVEGLELLKDSSNALRRELGGKGVMAGH